MHNRLDEAHLIQFSHKMYGWTAERPKLSQSAKKQISELLMCNAVLSGCKDKIIFELNHCFGSVFEDVELINNLANELQTQHRTAKPPSKLGSQLRLKCDQLIASLEAAERGEERLTLEL